MYMYYACLRVHVYRWDDGGFIIMCIKDSINQLFTFGDQVFQQSVGTPMGTNCAPLLADLFSYSYEAEFVQKLTG